MINRISFLFYPYLDALPSPHWCCHANKHDEVLCVTQRPNIRTPSSSYAHLVRYLINKHGFEKRKEQIERVETSTNRVLQRATNHREVYDKKRHRASLQGFLFLVARLTHQWIGRLCTEARTSLPRTLASSTAFEPNSVCQIKILRFITVRLPTWSCKRINWSTVAYQSFREKPLTPPPRMNEL